jgi:hypothetical protein
MNTFTISPLPQNKFDELKAKLIGVHQATVTDTEINGHGVDATYGYDPAGAGALTVTVLHHPWYISLGTIQSELQKNVDSL